MKSLTLADLMYLDFLDLLIDEAEIARDNSETTYEFEEAQRDQDDILREIRKIKGE
jgi:hypothetical protein